MDIQNRKVPGFYGDYRLTLFPSGDVMIIDSNGDKVIVDQEDVRVFVSTLIDLVDVPLI